LTAAAIRARGLALAGWIANRIDPDMPAADENIAALESRLAAPLLAVFPFAAVAAPREFAHTIALAPLA
jgi:dethiobiotin synthetase